jgi:transcriptional regulator with XRE-family HTH domain
MTHPRPKKSEEYKYLIAWTGKRIRNARESMRLGQEDFIAGAKLKRSFAWLSDIERGLNSIDPHDLKALARFTGFPTDWFLEPDFDSRKRAGPETRVEWNQLYDDRERAEAHWQLDQIFGRLIARYEGA